MVYFILELVLVSMERGLGDEFRQIPQYQKKLIAKGEGGKRKEQKGKSVKKKSSREKANSQDNAKTVVGLANAYTVPEAIR
jgi:hypothetical protein